MTKIRLFTTPDCPFSKKARALLRDRGFPFEDHNVLEDEEARGEMIRISGQTAVPVMEIRKVGEEPVLIAGYDEAKIKEALGLGGE
jgi:glutaredoxin